MLGQPQTQPQSIFGTAPTTLQPTYGQPGAGAFSGQNQHGINTGLNPQPHAQPQPQPGAAQGLNLGPTAGQPNPAQNLGQQNQPQSLKNLATLRTDHLKAMDDLIKVGTLKDQVDKNMVSLDKMAKNALSDYKPGAKRNPKNQYDKVRIAYDDWRRKVADIKKKQDETIRLLRNLTQELEKEQRSSYFSEVEEETLIDAIKTLIQEMDYLETRAREVINLQDSIFGVNSQQNTWDSIVQNLSECLVWMDEQTNDVEQLLKKCEEHPKMKPQS